MARWMLYSHDALGLGHVRRSLAIARAVLHRRSDLTALLVTCSPVIDALPIPPGLDYIKLPSAKKSSNGRYVPRRLAIPPMDLRTLRRRLLAGAFDEFQPDLFLVDKTPAGLMGELGGILESLDEMASRPRLVLAWRDFLDDPETVLAEWREAGTLELIRERYDEVWVFGDPRVHDVRVAYRLPGAVAERVRFLGYAVPFLEPAIRAEARRRLSPEGRPVLLVTAGGGEDGERLVATFLEAARRQLLPRDLRLQVVLGPCMPPAVAQSLRDGAPTEVAIASFVPDLAPWIAAADVVVGMAGYNTAVEVMGAEVPAVLLPRTTPRREQLLRARALARLGIAECLEPDGLTPERLAGAVFRALALPRPVAPATVSASRTEPLLRDGLHQVVHAFERLLPAPLETERAS